MQQYKILLTGAGAPGMSGILKCLKKANDSSFSFIGADMNPLASCRKEFSKFFTIPAGKDPNFISELLRICKTEEVDLVMSCVTRELLSLSKNKDKFEEIGTRVAVMDSDILETVNNKGKLLLKLKELGLDVPDFIVAESWNEIESFADRIDYKNNPFCVKGVEGNGSRAVRVILPYQDLFNSFFNEKPNGTICSYNDIKHILSNRSWPCKMMAMEYLPGSEYSVDILAENGEVKAVICRKATLVVSSNQMQCVVEKNSYVEDFCIKIVKELGLSGNIGFDLKEDYNGIPKIMEINPRYTGGIVAGLAANVNLPYLGIKTWLDIPFDVPQVRYGVRMMRRLEDLFFDENDNQIFI